MKSSIKINQFSDEKLVKEIIETRDNVLFAELYDRYAATVYNKCLGFAKSKVDPKDKMILLMKYQDDLS